MAVRNASNMRQVFPMQSVILIYTSNSDFPRSTVHDLSSGLIILWNTVIS